MEDRAGPCASSPFAHWYTHRAGGEAPASNPGLQNNIQTDAMPRIHTASLKTRHAQPANLEGILMNRISRLAFSHGISVFGQKNCMRRSQSLSAFPAFPLFFNIECLAVS